MAGITQPQKLTVCLKGKSKTGAIRAPARLLTGPNPAGTATENRGSAFRGKGWGGTNYLSGPVNGSITLNIVYEWGDGTENAVASGIASPNAVPKPSGSGTAFGTNAASAGENVASAGENALDSAENGLDSQESDPES
jgi:hypothetical protein